MSQPVFATPPHLYVFYAVVVGIWGLGEYLSRRRRRAEKSDREDRGSFRVLQAAVLAGAGVGLAGTLWLERAAIARPRAAFWVGIALVLTGVAVRRVAMWSLRGHYSYRVAVRPDHEVVETGPYRWVRHPAYTGGALCYVGLGVATGNWVAVLALALASAVGYGYRIRVEEDVLRTELGEAYEEYAHRVPYRLVPLVW